ncbi:MAG: hypothetical protein IPK66_03850 [Rhodospirillales bacterium]|nr:hypothetical protein [Rhodospirillales bacterium]
MRTAPTWMRTIALVALAAALATALRLLVIEEPEFAWVCQSAAPPWWCPLRADMIALLQGGSLGFIALAVGLLAMARGCVTAARLALVTGTAGLVLYLPEPAAGGALMGALVMLRR